MKEVPIPGRALWDVAGEDIKLPEAPGPITLRNTDSPGKNEVKEWVNTSLLAKIIGNLGCGRAHNSLQEQARRRQLCEVLLRSVAGQQAQ